ncbi:hypothetical protein SUGI_0130440 [Cryptomeria japonica]|nr:hypothetical protein SUGI_0130440 [Cryptomeria japonica]
MSGARLSLLSCTILTGILMFSPKSCSSNSLTAYEVLQEYGFPIGLLPANVVSYTLDTSDGSFVVNLNSTCKFKIDSYHLKYKKKFTGTISYDSLKDLDGISVKVWFFYLSINKVLREGDELEFYVGSFSASFPVSNFDVCPQCGCGLDCVGVDSQSLLEDS